MPKIELRFRGRIPADIEDPQAILVFHREYLLAFKESLEILRHMVRARTPVGVSGRLYKSITYQMKDLTPKDGFGFLAGPPQFEGEVFARTETSYFWGIFPSPYSWVCPYADAVESGTRPHWPPVIELRDWASRVLYLARPEASLAAYFIGRKISKVGTRGRFMFTSAQQEFMASGILERNFSLASLRARSQVEVELPWWAES